MLIIDKESININAKEKWDKKDIKLRLKQSKKYQHLFKQTCDWTLNFDDLNFQQRLLLIKGELIRTYDAMTNQDKTKLKNLLQLSNFSSKWHRLSSCDKDKLMKFVI